MSISTYKEPQDAIRHQKSRFAGTGRKLYIESYGCQMNFSDSEIVASILSGQGFSLTDEVSEADLVLLNTCSIRDKAEQTIRKRLQVLNSQKKVRKGMKIGILGCMAERLKNRLLEEEKIVDMVVGPDAYKDLPNLLEELDQGREAVNVILSKEETYGDISPVRLQSNGISAFVTIMRGCDNMCTFCVVPFTRGRERSRSPHSILEEVQSLEKQGFKEVTLLGQNVDSYLWYGGGAKRDFQKASEMEKATAVDFAELLSMIAAAHSKMRIRFSTSNPQDMTLSVLHTMAKYPNICKHIHLPLQSGSDRILKKMNRQHTAADYRALIGHIRNIIGDCGISQDMIAGFPTETEEDHQNTLAMMEYVKYDFGYMFAYSERPGTFAARHYSEDVSQEIKQRRLSEIISLQNKHSLYRNRLRIGQLQEVLVEGHSKKSVEHLMGRNSQNVVAVFPKEGYKIGDMVRVEVLEATSATLVGRALGSVY